MRNYSPMRLPPTTDRVLRNELRRTNDWLRQLGPQIGRTVIVRQGTPAVVTQSVDLSQFLYLPGRAPLQRAFGNVTFDTDGGFVSQPLDTIVGLALKAIQAAGNTTTIYFNTGDSGQDYIGRWTFPITGTSPSDNIFVAESASQTITNKTITAGVIQVGATGQRNIFRSLDFGQTKEFFLAPNTGFPNTSTLTPQLRMPSLNQSTPLTDRHTFMMLNSSLTAPFVTGSIAHGNHDGSEMQMLPTGGNGRALRFNIGETVATTTWTNGGTTITGTFDTTKTRPGMRVRGNNGSAVYVDENTMIVTVSSTQITVDTPLVGNNAATVTVQTWGPTWDFELSGVDHGSLTGLNDDDHLQYLNLTGRTGGQVLGSGAHTGANTVDLTLEGRLMLGDGLTGINYTAGRVLDIRGSASNGATFISIQNTLNTPASGAASGTLTMFLVQPNSPAYTSGSYVFRGLNFTMTGTPAPSGVTVSALTAIFCQATPAEGGDPGSGGTFGSITNYRGADVTVQGTSVPANRTITATTNGTTALTSAGLFVAPIAAGQVISKADVPARTTIASITDASNLVMSNAATGSATGSTSFFPISTGLTGMRFVMSARTKPFTSVACLKFENASGGNSYADFASILEVDATTPFNTAGVGEWSVIRMAAGPTLPVASWVFNISATTPSRHGGMFSIGKTATPTRFVDLGAGTAAIAPLGFVAGTNLTAATIGSVEYDGSYWYLTHGDAVRTTVVSQRGTVNLTAQAAAIGATTLYTPPAAGYYVVHYTLEDTAADVTAGTIQFQVNYTDDIGATNQTGAALAMTAVGRDRGSFQIWSNSGVISYQTNLVGIFGTARYALRVRLESLG